VHELIRKQVPFLSADRRMDADVAAVVELIREGALSRAALGG
jgi:histidine ammonia-lyase/phenylalanine ammonia-lyase